MSDKQLYIRVRKNAFVLFDPERVQMKEYVSTRPFANRRIAVADFIVAEEFLRSSIKDFYSTTWIRPSPVAIIHQEYLFEGGLCSIETRVLNELALSAGARKVYVWQGRELNRLDIENEVYV